MICNESQNCNKSHTMSMWNNINQIYNKYYQIHIVTYKKGCREKRSKYLLKNSVFIISLKMFLLLYNGSIFTQHDLYNTYIQNIKTIYNISKAMDYHKTQLDHKFKNYTRKQELMNRQNYCPLFQQR